MPASPRTLLLRARNRLRRAVDWRAAAAAGFAPTLALAARRPPRIASLDDRPWEHPFLVEPNLRSFREYSEGVWQVAGEHARRREGALSCAFSVNMAQNMYKWAELSQRDGVRATLFPHGWDTTAINLPEWEEYDGTWSEPLDGEAFLASHPGIELRVPAERIPLDAGEETAAYEAFARGERAPLLRLAGRDPDVRWDMLFASPALASYFPWARALGRFDVVYAASIPLPAYLSGRPYLVFAVGGDLTFDCGRADAYGEAMSLAFASARFLTVSNPHALGHCRRLGFENGVYLPYPMDDDVYSPGHGRSRAEWDARLGPGVWVLSTARIDAKWKGTDASHFEALLAAARRRPELRFALVAWGSDRQAYEQRIHRSGARDRFLLIEPAGKRRLIDYLRSCDVVLDQLGMGYYGATGLEAASVGRPIVTKLRVEHYAPLYAGDVMPAVSVSGAGDLEQAICDLAGDPERRAVLAERTRAWLVRTHGRERTVPLLRGLLGLAADRVELPPDLTSPLCAPPGPEEQAYHASRRVPAGTRW